MADGQASTRVSLSGVREDAAVVELAAAPWAPQPGLITQRRLSPRRAPGSGPPWERGRRAHAGPHPGCALASARHSGC